MDDSHLDYKQKFLKKKKPLTGSCKMTCTLYFGLSIAFNSIIIYDDSILGIIFFFGWWANQSVSLQKKRKQESTGH